VLKSFCKKITAYKESEKSAFFFDQLLICFPYGGERPGLPAGPDS